VLGLRKEVEVGAGGQLPLAGLPGLEQLQAAAVELALERGHERQRLRREDLVESGKQRAGDLNAVHAVILSGMRKSDSEVWKSRYLMPSFGVNEGPGGSGTVRRGTGGGPRDGSGTVQGRA